MAGYRVYIDGAVGTTGLQLQRRLLAQGDITLITLPETRRRQLEARLAAAASAEVAVLCLPDEASREFMAAAPEGMRICDASTAHRTAPGWVYGFPELGGRRRRLREARRVAVPGCHASGFLALVAPLVEGGLLSPAAPLHVSSVTGYSGGGKAMIAEYEAQGRGATFDAPRQYALGMQHKHLPEMRAVAGLAAPPLFTPIVADYYSGMLLSLALRAEDLTGIQTAKALVEFYKKYYCNEPLIGVCGEAPDDGALSAGALAGRDDMELHVLGGGGQILLAARYDNLGKGAAGAALQCLNLMLGRPETAGLRLRN